MKPRRNQSAFFSVSSEAEILQTLSEKFMSHQFRRADAYMDVS